MNEPAQVVPAEYIPEDRFLSASQIKAQADKVLEVVKAVMRPEVHYGKIPGTDKNTLLKPGSEALLSTFRIAVDPVITDLSTNDSIRYRVHARGLSMASGSYLGSGIGECSSDEEKYCWRGAVCDQEFDATPEDRRRTKWKKGREGKAYSLKQVRTNPADVANTILKMAKKRAQIDLTLTVTAASDVFQQDMEDLPDEVRDAIVAADKPKPPPVQQPARTQQPPAPQGTAPSNGYVISEPQSKRLYAIYKNAGITDDQMKDYLFTEYNIEHTKDIKRADYEAICAWAQGGRVDAGAQG